MSVAYDLNNRWSITGPIKIDTRLRPKSIGGTYYAAVTGSDQFSDYEGYNFSDWDGFGAVAIAEETIHAARRFYSLLPRRVPRPDIAPGADGTIGLEWRFGPSTGRTVTFIEIGPGDAVKAFRIYPSDTSPSVWPKRPIRTDTVDFISQLFPSDESY